ncbi:hypothetical protein Ddye_011788 [Dipteronia dyeriana]|uniref:Uncharacterized protein n=1 Tax=Dipteronia dyeriana TaxID=168575 RepID=A0AAD9X3A2_9ROSI|nr:hypothetical protein Ddye_011788 [Dipteronia dyeriana]
MSKHGTLMKSVDVFDSRWRFVNCKETRTCYWSVRDDGFYFTDAPGNKWHKFRGWGDD